MGSGGPTGPRPRVGGGACRLDVLEDADVLTIAYVVIEVITALALIFLILMHSGKGGGLSDMFGGGIGAAAQGSTVVERNLDRITIMVALIFALTSVTLDLRLQ
jgi:preprotein translocase subunit SecG